MALIEGEDAAAVALGAGDHGRVDQAKREVGVPADQGANARQVLLAAIKRVGAVLKVGEEHVEGRRRRTLLEQVANLA